jgi:hypothetical protein
MAANCARDAARMVSGLPKARSNATIAACGSARNDSEAQASRCAASALIARLSPAWLRSRDQTNRRKAKEPGSLTADYGFRA